MNSQANNLGDSGIGLTDVPLWFLNAVGDPGRELAPIITALLILSVAVVVVIAVMISIPLVRAALGRSAGAGAGTPRSEAPALRWIYVGLLLTTATLSIFVFWTATTLAAIEAPASEPALTVEVVGHQFWWELRYRDSEDTEEVVTANEIHIPAGEPVLVRLRSDDVIHSFWVPALGGKTDMIPGQVNETWLEASKPGTYLGQCAEYCGLQHAHMAFRVVAEPRNEFRSWLSRESRPAAGPTSPLERSGAKLFSKNCGECHTVRGQTTSSEPGPDLTHLMSRDTIAAGMLPNTPGHLAGWITNPRTLKPGTTMPAKTLTSDELAALLAYVVSLE